MLKEFRDFIMRGNVLDLAVGIIIGAAFTAIVTSLVDDLVTPLLGVFIGGIDFSSISFGLGDAHFMIGNFINAMMKFAIIAWVVFMIIKAVNRLKTLSRKPAEIAPAAPPGPSQEQLLTEIRDLLKAR